MCGCLRLYFFAVCLSTHSTICSLTACVERTMSALCCKVCNVASHIAYRLICLFVLHLVRLMRDIRCLSVCRQWVRIRRAQADDAVGESTPHAARSSTQTSHAHSTSSAYFTRPAHCHRCFQVASSWSPRQRCYRHHRVAPTHLSAESSSVSNSSTLHRQLAIATPDQSAGINESITEFLTWPNCRFLFRNQCANLTH